MNNQVVTSDNLASLKLEPSQTTLEHKTMDKTTTKSKILEKQFFENQTDTEWMTIEEIAAHLRTKVSHIRELVYRNEIPHSKLGRLLRFHRQTVDDWMLSR